jgi:hypothetical protein
MASVSFYHHLMSVVSQTKLALMFPMSSRTSIVSWCWFVIDIAATGLWNFWLVNLLNRLLKNGEGIGVKLGTYMYVPINVDSKCWDLSADRTFKMAAKYIFTIILLRTAMHNSPELFFLANSQDFTLPIHHHLTKVSGFFFKKCILIYSTCEICDYLGFF